MSSDRYVGAIKALESIVWAMDDAVKSMWSGAYTGMMVSVGRLLANSFLERMIYYDLKSLLKEIEVETYGIIKFEPNLEENRILIKNCIVRELINSGILETDNSMCAFLKGFLTKVLDGVDVKVKDVCFDSEGCKILLQTR